MKSVRSTPHLANDAKTLPKKSCLQAVCRAVLAIAFSLAFSAPLVAQTVAKVNSQNISLSQLRTFLEVKMFISGQTNVDSFYRAIGNDANGVLQEYINHVLLLQSAKKNKITPNSKAVKDKLKSNKNQWVSDLFLSQEINLSSIKVTEADLKKEFAKLGAREKKYGDLNATEMNNLRQITILKISQVRKNELRKKLEKKHKIKRNKFSNKVVFEIGKKKFSQADFNKFLNLQLAGVNISAQSLKERDPNRYNQIATDVLDEMVLRELLKIEIEKTRFADNKTVKKVAQFLSEQVAIETFIAQVIASQIKISDSDLDNTFKVVSKQNPEIGKMLPTKQEKMLREIIIQQRLPKIIATYIEERREESVIKRYKDQLSKL